MNYIPHTLLLTRAQGEQLEELAYHFHKSKSAVVRDCLNVHLPLLAEAFDLAKRSENQVTSPPSDEQPNPLRSLDADGGSLQMPAENFLFSPKVNPDPAPAPDEDSVGDRL
jgi:hypothetical protein